MDFKGTIPHGSENIITDPQDCPYDMLIWIWFRKREMRAKKRKSRWDAGSEEAQQKHTSVLQN
jgi:hypothetical protein